MGVWVNGVEVDCISLSQDEIPIARVWQRVLTHGFVFVETNQVYIVGINADSSRRVIDRRMVESCSDNVADSDFIGIVDNFQGRPQ